MTNTLIALFPFAVFFAWIVYSALAATKKCPDCDAPLPRVQSPLKKTFRQWIEGGYLCGKCGCEADTSGKKVAPGTMPDGQYAAFMMAMLAAAAVPALLLLAILLSL